MTNRDAIKEQIECLPKDNKIRTILENILIYAYNNELSKFPITINHRGIIQITIGYSILFESEEIPIIFQHLKDTGELKKSITQFNIQNYEEIDKLNNKIQEIKELQNKVNNTWSRTLCRVK